jgi:hypothetical protein
MQLATSTSDQPGLSQRTAWPLAANSQPSCVSLLDLVKIANPTCAYTRIRGSKQCEGSQTALAPVKIPALHAPVKIPALQL